MASTPARSRAPPSRLLTRTSASTSTLVFLSRPAKPAHTPLPNSPSQVPLRALSSSAPEPRTRSAPGWQPGTLPASLPSRQLPARRHVGSGKVRGGSPVTKPVPVLRSRCHFFLTPPHVCQKSYLES